MQQKGGTDGGDHRPEIVDGTGISRRKKPQTAVVKGGIQKIPQKSQKACRTNVPAGKRSNLPDLPGDAQV